LKKHFIPLILSFIFIFSLNSCSVKIQEKEKEFAKLTCEERFQEILKYSKEPFTKAKVKGRLQTEGITLTFIGKIGDSGEINFYLPFGKKVLSLKTKDDDLCINYNKGNICNKEKLFYKRVLDIDIPFQFRELISGRYKIDENAEYRCEGDKVIVKTKDVELIYKYLKPQIVKYDDYRIEYTYDNDLIPKTINLYLNDKLKMKIKILKVEK